MRFLKMLMSSSMSIPCLTPTMEKVWMNSYSMIKRILKSRKNLLKSYWDKLFSISPRQISHKSLHHISWQCSICTKTQKLMAWDEKICWDYHRKNGKEYLSNKVLCSKNYSNSLMSKRKDSLALINSEMLSFRKRWKMRMLSGL